MKLKKLVAFAPLVAMALGLPGGSARAAGQEFGDMSGYEWGLSHVIKMSAMGIMKGKGPGIFAPGARITFQESAVAIVRLIGKEADAQAMSEAEINAQLSTIPDREEIAAWARASVALLVRLGTVSPGQPFEPTAHVSRLDVTVLLVKALGYEAEAQAKMQASLGFRDAEQMAANFRGYVAVATEQRLITGYEDQTFRPTQAVKRVEMAVIAGRADDHVHTYRADVVSGTVISVDPTEASVAVWASGVSLKVGTQETAAVFVNGEAKPLSAIEVGMRVTIKLQDAGGKAVFIEARPADGQTTIEVTGTITNLAEAGADGKARISVGIATGGVTIGTVYNLDGNASIKINGRTAAFADLSNGDQVELTAAGSNAIAVKVTRPVKTIQGSVATLTAETATSLAKVTVRVEEGDTSTTAEYFFVGDAAIKVNGEAAAITDLRIGDDITLTVLSGLVLVAEAERDTVVSGHIRALAGPSGDTPATISASYTINGTTAVNTFRIGDQTEILVNAQSVHVGALQLGEPVRLTFRGETLLKVEVTR